MLLHAECGAFWQIDYLLESLRLREREDLNMDFLPAAALECLPIMTFVQDVQGPKKKDPG